MFIVTAKEMYDMDRYTMHEIGLPGTCCKSNAGREHFVNLSEKADFMTLRQDQIKMLGWIHRCTVCSLSAKYWLG